MSLEETAEYIAALGGELVEQRVYSPDFVDGVIIGQDPPADQPLTEVMTVLVALGPAELTLAELGVVDFGADDCCTDLGSDAYGDHEVGFATLDINGITYPDSLFVDVEDQELDETIWVEFDLGRDFDRLVGVVGYEDRSPSEGRLRIEVLTEDGQVLWDKNYRLGESDEFAPLDVSGVLRLRIQVTRIVEFRGNALAALGRPVLLGDPNVVERYRR